MKNEMNVSIDIIYNNKENFKDNEYILMMNTLMMINKVLPKYSYNKNHERVAGYRRWILDCCEA